MDRAICLGEYFLAQALRAFDHMLTDPVLGDADYLVSVIQRKQWPAISRRDLHAAANRSRFPRAADLDLPLKMLEDNGYLLREPEAQRGKGRPPVAAACLAGPPVPTCRVGSYRHGTDRPPVLWFGGFCGDFTHSVTSIVFGPPIRPTGPGRRAEVVQAGALADLLGL